MSPEPGGLVVGFDLDHLLRDYLPDTEIGPAGDRFRAIYPDTAVAPTPAFPGAHEAIAAVRRVGGRVLLVTGKHPPNAQLHVDHLGLDVDHVHDVEGARAAGVTSVSVLTGGCTEAELRDAGTDVVLADLTAFPHWLEGHLAESARPR